MQLVGFRAISASEAMEKRLIGAGVSSVGIQMLGNHFGLGMIDLNPGQAFYSS